MSRLIVHGTGRSGTTVTQRVINFHPDVWVTNEFLLYDIPFGYYMRSVRSNKTAEEYFKSLLYRDGWNTSVEHDWHVPPTLNFDTFVSQCLEVLVGNEVTDWIAAAEKILYKDNYKYYGDKLLESEVLQKMFDLGMDYKLVHIVRDLRDVVAAKMFHRFEINKSDTYDGDCTIDYNTWKRVRANIPPENYVEIKFEDFANGTVNIDKICKLLGDLDTKPLYKGFSEWFDPKKLKIGLYKEIIPNWKNVFKKESIEVLEELGYI